MFWVNIDFLFFVFKTLAFAKRILEEGGPNPRQGKKTDNAHPPIHPTKYVANLQVMLINLQNFLMFLWRERLDILYKHPLFSWVQFEIIITKSKFFLTTSQFTCSDNDRIYFKTSGCKLLMIYLVFGKETFRKMRKLQC